MSGETVEKRLREDMSPRMSEKTSSKRRKCEEDVPEMVVTKPQGTKVDPSELASAFALASLASLSPSSGDKLSRPLIRGEQAASTVRLVEDAVSISGSWETRSPKADPAPITPEVRAPAGATGGCTTRRVHFAPNTKEHQVHCQPQSHPSQTELQLQQAGQEGVPLTPSTPHLTVSPQPHRGIVTVSPRSPQAQGHGAFVPRSPHPYGMTYVRSHHLNPNHPATPHGAPPPPRHLRLPSHRHHHLHYQQMHTPPPWIRGRMIPPPARLMQPPLLHPENQWICDYCNVAAFATYEDACMHEEACKVRCSLRPLIREKHAVTRMRRQVPPSMVMSSGDLRQGSPAALVVASRSNSADEEGSAVGDVESAPSGKQPWYSGSTSLAIEESDREWLSELNCFVRRHCVEAFSATSDDVAKTSKRGRIAIDQVGIRCRFCSHLPLKDKAVAAVSFPTAVAGIYESVKRWQRVHLEVCHEVPIEVKSQLSALANANVWVPTTRQYWTDSAKALGLADTSEGIRFGSNPLETSQKGFNAIAEISGGKRKDGTAVHGLNGSDDLHPTDSAVASEVTEIGNTSMVHDGTGRTEVIVEAGHIVLPEDMEMIPPYVYFLMRQVEPCRFTEADRFVARSKGPVGYPGFQCRHCNGHAGLGKYFPVSAKSLSTNSTSQNIHAHLLKCRKCPNPIKDRLVQLKIEKSRSPRMEPGWRKVFFDKVWARLHC